VRIESWFLIKFHFTKSFISPTLFYSPTLTTTIFLLLPFLNRIEWLRYQIKALAKSHSTTCDPGSFREVIPLFFILIFTFNMKVRKTQEDGWILLVFSSISPTEFKDQKQLDYSFWSDVQILNAVDKNREREERHKAIIQVPSTNRK